MFHTPSTQERLVPTRSGIIERFAGLISEDSFAALDKLLQYLHESRGSAEEQQDSSRDATPAFTGSPSRRSKKLRNLSVHDPCGSETPRSLPSSPAKAIAGQAGISPPRASLAKSPRPGRSPLSSPGPASSRKVGPSTLQVNTPNESFPFMTQNLDRSHEVFAAEEFHLIFTYLDF